MSFGPPRGSVTSSINSTASTPAASARRHNAAASNAAAAAAFAQPLPPTPGVSVTHSRNSSITSGARPVLSSVASAPPLPSNNNGASNTAGIGGAGVNGAVGASGSFGVSSVGPSGASSEAEVPALGDGLGVDDGESPSASPCTVLGPGSGLNSDVLSIHSEACGSVGVAGSSVASCVPYTEALARWGVPWPAAPSPGGASVTSNGGAASGTIGNVTAVSSSPQKRGVPVAGVATSEEADLGLLDEFLDLPGGVLKEHVKMVQEAVKDMKKGLHESVMQLHVAVASLDSRVAASEGDMDALRKQLGGGQEQMKARLEEVVSTVGVFQSAISSCRDEIRESKKNFEQCQKAIGSLAGGSPGSGTAVLQMAHEMGALQIEFTDFQKHMTHVHNKLHSDVKLLDGQTRDGRERLHKLEAQFAGLHGTVRETVNDIILVKQESMRSRQMDASGGTQGLDVVVGSADVSSPRIIPRKLMPDPPPNGETVNGVVVKQENLRPRQIEVPGAGADAAVGGTGYPHFSSPPRKLMPDPPPNRETGNGVIVGKQESIRPRQIEAPGGGQGSEAAAIGAGYPQFSSPPRKPVQDHLPNRGSASPEMGGRPAAEWSGGGQGSDAATNGTGYPQFSSPRMLPRKSMPDPPLNRGSASPEAGGRSTQECGLGKSPVGTHNFSMPGTPDWTNGHTTKSVSSVATRQHIVPAAMGSAETGSLHDVQSAIQPTTASSTVATIIAPPLVQEEKVPFALCSPEVSERPFVIVQSPQPPHRPTSLVAGSTTTEEAASVARGIQVHVEARLPAQVLQRASSPTNVDMQQNRQQHTMYAQLLQSAQSPSLPNVQHVGQSPSAPPPAQLPPSQAPLQTAARRVRSSSPTYATATTVAATVASARIPQQPQQLVQQPPQLESIAAQRTPSSSPPPAPIVHSHNGPPPPPGVHLQNGHSMYPVPPPQQTAAAELSDSVLTLGQGGFSSTSGTTPDVSADYGPTPGADATAIAAAIHAAAWQGVAAAGCGGAGAAAAGALGLASARGSFGRGGQSQSLPTIREHGGSKRQSAPAYAAAAAAAAAAGGRAIAALTAQSGGGSPCIG